MFNLSYIYRKCPRMIKLRLWRSWKTEGWWQSNRESITVPASSKTWQIQPCCSGFSVMNRKAYWDIWWRLGGISGDYKETSITEIRIFGGKGKFLRAKRSLVPDRHMHHASTLPRNTGFEVLKWSLIEAEACLRYVRKGHWQSYSW